MNKKLSKKYMIGLVAAVGVLIAAGLFVFLQKDTLLKIIEYVGDVVIQRVDRTLPVYEGMRVEVGDTLDTKLKSHATLQIDDTKFVRLKENSQATFHELVCGKETDNISIHLEQGTLINDIRTKLSEDSTYSVTTPNTTVSVRGTYFVVTVGEKDGYEGVVTVVNVYHGQVGVKCDNGQEIILGPGQSTDDVVFGSDDGKENLLVDKGAHAVIGKKVAEMGTGLDWEGLDLTDLINLQTYFSDDDAGFTPGELEDKIAEAETQVEETETPSDTEKDTGNEEDKTDPESETETSTEDDSENENTPSTTTVSTGIPSAPEPPEIIQTAVPGENGQTPGAQPAQTPGTNPTPDPTRSPTDTPDKPSGTGGDTSPTQEGESPQTDNTGGTGTIINGGGTPSETPSGKPDDTNPPAPPPTPDPDPTLPEEGNVTLTIPNLTDVEGQITEVSTRIEAFDPIRDSLTPEQQSALEKAEAGRDAAKQTIVDVNTVNGVLDTINKLPPSSAVSESDRAAVEEARKNYDSLTETQSAYVPDVSKNKLENCEKKLNGQTAN